MEASGQNSRPSRRRLYVLLTIALVGYEFALYQHLISAVPLRPDAVIPLRAGQAAMGFLPNLGFGIARGNPISAGDYFALCQGPVEARAFPSGELIDHWLSSVDYVTAAMPYGRQAMLNSNLPTTEGLFSNRPTAFHPTPDAMPMTIFHFLDDRRMLYLVEQTLHCCDRTTNRLLWTKRGISSVSRIEGDLAYVQRPFIDPESRKLVPAPAIMDLRDGSVRDLVAPGPNYDVLDLSPDGTSVLYALNQSFQLSRLTTGEAVWTRTFDEVGARRLSFTADGESLVSWYLDEAGNLSCSRVRAADGAILQADLRNPSVDSVRYPSIALLADRYAVFQYLWGDASAKPKLYDFVTMFLARRGMLQSSSKASENWLAMYDVERREWVGLIKTTRSKLFADPQGRGFALQRESKTGGPTLLEMYTLPPRRDWEWLMLRGLGAPVGLGLIVASYRALARRRLRRA